MQATLTKALSGFVPATPQDVAAFERVKTGESIFVEWRKPRNIKFHNKYFALLTFVFECWEPETLEYKGRPVEKNFKRFRKEIAIMAGFYDLVVNINGEVRMEAKSISFGSMDDDEFAELYNKSIDVVLKKVLNTEARKKSGCKEYTPEELENAVNELMSFT